MQAASAPSLRLPRLQAPGTGAKATERPSTLPLGPARPPDSPRRMGPGEPAKEAKAEPRPARPHPGGGRNPSTRNNDKAVTTIRAANKRI